MPKRPPKYSDWMASVLERWGDFLATEPTPSQARAAGVQYNGQPISEWRIKAIRYYLRTLQNVGWVEEEEEEEGEEEEEEPQYVHFPDAPFQEKKPKKQEPERQAEAGKTHLVIGDAHARPDESLERFTWLGKIIVHLRPDVVVNIGDWADMESLSSYDKGRRSAENRRYSRDLTAANEALRLMHVEIDKHNAEHPEDQVHPRFIWTVGNHEYRVSRFGDDNPTFDGASLEDLDFAKRGWEVIPFLEPIIVDGVEYAHYACKQNNRRPISGDYAPRWLVLTRHGSAVVGHSHRLQYHREVGAGGRRLHGLVCGCYVGGWHDYAKQSNEGWWRGLCVLRNVKEGDFDLELWSSKRIQQKFG